MNREDIVNTVSEIAKVWDRRAMEDELTHASIKIMAQHVEIERLRALLNEAADDLDDWGAYSKATKYRQDDRTTK